MCWCHHEPLRGLAQVFQRGDGHARISRLTGATTSRLRSKATMAALALTTISGCVALDEAEGDIARKQFLTRQKQTELAAAQRGDVIFDPTPYYGREVAVERGRKSGTPLPKEVEGARSFKLTGTRLGINDLAEEIQRQTGLPARVKSRYVVGDGDLLTVPIQARVSITHEGSLSKALDKIAGLMDIDWSYDGRVITFSQMITREYRVSLPAGSSSLTTNVGGVSGGARTVEMTREISEYDAWSDLEGALASAAPPPASVKVSRTAGRISVFGPPSVQTRVFDVVSDFEATFAKRIGLEVAVFFVDANKADDFGVGLRLASSAGDVSATLTGAIGSLSGNGVATISRGATRAIDFKALATDQAVVDYRIGSSIAQSGQISPIILTRSQNYVSKATTTTRDGASSTAIETNTVDTGVSIHALPRLVDEGKIQLSLTILQNDLTNLTSFVSGNSTVQLPTIDQRAIQNDSVLRAGETLILSGYEQEKSTRSDTGTGKAGFMGLGGSTKGSTRKIRMIVMVRPAIIPLSRS